MKLYLSVWSVSRLIEKGGGLALGTEHVVWSQSPRIDILHVLVLRLYELE